MNSTWRRNGARVSFNPASYFICALDTLMKSTTSIRKNAFLLANSFQCLFLFVFFFKKGKNK